MKTIFAVVIGLIASATCQAQYGRPPKALPPVHAVSTRPGQFPNYSPNNSSFDNNSMQTNRPSTPNAGSFGGNGDYIDPTKNPSTPTMYNNNTIQLPAPTPVNGNGADNTNRGGVDYYPNPALDRR